MKLTIVALTRALACQFQQAPHYVGFTYVDDKTGSTVTLNSGDTPSLTSTSQKKDKKTVYSVAVSVPTNGGLLAVFGGSFDSDAEATAVGKLVRAAVKAYVAQVGAETTPDVL